MSEKKSESTVKKTVSSLFTLNSLGFKNEYVQVLEDKCNSCFGESLADPTYYVPNSELVKRVKGGSSSVVGHYDFSDGRDNGSSDMLFARRKGLDLAEVSQKIYQSEQALNDVVQKVGVSIVDAQKKAVEKVKASQAQKQAQSVVQTPIQNLSGSSGNLN